MTYPGAPRSTSHGLVYVANWRMITELKISQKGSLYVRRNIALDQIFGIRSVAVGPQTGQLCVLVWQSNDRHMKIYIVSLGDSLGITDRRSGPLWSDVSMIQRTLIMPDQMKGIPVISAVHTASTDQVLVTTQYLNKPRCSSVLYRGRQLSFLANLTHESCVPIAYKDHFLMVDYLRANILVLDNQGHIVHTVDYSNGYLLGISDIAVWQDRVFVVGFNGELLLLSPV